MQRIKLLIIGLILPLILVLTLQVLRHNHQHQALPLFDGLGEHHHPISTQSSEAQRYFDQGLILAYGFNHAEAERSFRAAARLDPDCAMCYWGVAYVLGPNTNAAMPEEAVPKAYAAIQTALDLADQASEPEQAYIQALAQRYVLEPIADRTELDLAYANAMRELVRRYPEDLDAATMLAEALMNTTPWDYWTDEGQPRPVTKEILATLESVIKRDLNHAGANHLYIHAVEAVHPKWGEAAADRLGDLVPGAGHLVHMPSHIYIRVGRYHDAAIANEKAIAVDQDYVTQCHAGGLYKLAYMPHNEHFLLASATLEGRSETAIATARHMAANADPKMMRTPGLAVLQHYSVTPLYALTHFGQWDEILATPAPADDLRYPTGVWHYARGLALTRKNELDAAAKELEQLQAIAADPALQTETIWDLNSTASLLAIAAEVLTGELAAQAGDYENAIAHLETAVKSEDALVYDEPADWYQPVRQFLGAALLAADRPTEAETVYQQDLARYPQNGWSLFGLAQSLQMQGQVKAAQTTQDQFEAAWQHADIDLVASRF
ncbi:MAG: tetratricopeptide repeat protein [Cyanothece sp. SIO1E1]|nr:tetratricopeptide repeat protein [Cyanothece sp. SIO1E1]